MFAHEVKNAIIFTQEGSSFSVVYRAQVRFNYDVYKIYVVWEIFNLRSSSGLVSPIDIGKNWACYQAAKKRYENKFRNEAHTSPGAMPYC